MTGRQRDYVSSPEAIVDIMTPIGGAIVIWCAATSIAFIAFAYLGWRKNRR